MRATLITLFLSAKCGVCGKLSMSSNIKDFTNGQYIFFYCKFINKVLFYRVIYSHFDIIIHIYIYMYTFVWHKWCFRRFCKFVDTFVRTHLNCTNEKTPLTKRLRSIETFQNRKNRKFVF